MSTQSTYQHDTLAASPARPSLLKTKGIKKANKARKPLSCKKMRNEHSVSSDGQETR